MRGSSDILAAVDTHLGFSRSKQRVTVTQTKMRYSLEIKPFWLKVEGDENNVVLEYQGQIDVSSNRLEDTHIAAILYEKEMSKKDLEITLKAKGIKANEKSLGNLLKVMQAEGLVEYRNGNGNTHLYYLKSNEDEITLDELNEIVESAKAFNIRTSKTEHSYIK
jgi:hypothetical protein